MRKSIFFVETDTFVYGGERGFVMRKWLKFIGVCSLLVSLLLAMNSYSICTFTKVDEKKVDVAIVLGAAIE